MEFLDLLQVQCMILTFILITGYLITQDSVKKYLNTILQSLPAPKEVLLWSMAKTVILMNAIQLLAIHVVLES